jgi:hypothetical protein
LRVLGSSPSTPTNNYKNMSIEKRTPEEESAKLNQVEDTSIALEAAYAGKPLRDIARENDVPISEEEKRVFDSVADRKAEKIIAKINEGKSITSALRVSSLNRAEERRRRPGGERHRFIRTDTEVSEEEWQAQLSAAEGTAIYEIINALHKFKNKPLLISGYPIVGQSPNLHFSALNAFFAKYNLLYRLGPLEYSGKYQHAKTFKLFIVFQG